MEAYCNCILRNFFFNVLKRKYNIALFLLIIKKKIRYFSYISINNTNSLLYLHMDIIFKITL